jgi:hypothetical protein
LDYLDFYSNGISIENPELMLRMQLAGNMLKYNEAENTATLQTNTLTNASEKLEGASTLYERMKDSLCTKLVSNYAELTNVYSSDLSQNIVFDNIVNEASMVSFIELQTASFFGSSKGYVFTELFDDTKALVINNPSEVYVYESSAGSFMENVHLIIATGDVLVNSNFEGLILSNGVVTLADNVSVISNNAYVKEALRLTAEEGGTTYSVIEFLRDGTDLLKIEGTDEEYESVKLADLVVYENWKKE